MDPQVCRHPQAPECAGSSLIEEANVRSRESCRVIGVSALLGLVALLAAAGSAYAQYPIMDMVAEKVIQKYQNSTCEQLWANRGKHSEQEQRAVNILKSDPQMRTAFFNKVAGPIVNKMFECGMIP
jgi:hypothetical protein